MHKKRCLEIRKSEGGRAATAYEGKVDMSVMLMFNMKATQIQFRKEMDGG